MKKIYVFKSHVVHLILQGYSSMDFNTSVFM